MFGGYLAIKRAAEDAYRILGRLYNNYAALKQAEPENPLLSLVKITEDGKPSPLPALCPVAFSYQLTPAFVERYAPSGETLQEKVAAMDADEDVDDMLSSLKFKKELTRYTVDLETEVKRIGEARDY